MARLHLFNSFLEKLPEGSFNFEVDSIGVILGELQPSVSNWKITQIQSSDLTFVEENTIPLSSSSQTNGVLTVSLSDSTFTFSTGGNFRYITLFKKDSDEIIGWYDAGELITAVTNDKITFDFLNNETLILYTDTRNTNVVYIDPSYGSGGNGTKEQPYDSLLDVTFASNTTYMLKRGTTMTIASQRFLSGLTNVHFKTYGTGALPKFISTVSGGTSAAIRWDNCTNLILDSWEIEGTGALYAIIRNETSNNITIRNCKLHGARYNSTTGGFGIRGGGNNLKIMNCEIYDVDNDGLYIAGTSNFEMGYCNIHHVNQYYSINASAGGDGIQLDGAWPNFYIHHCIIDRSDANTGNKFGIICNSAVGSNTNSKGIIEYCEFTNNANVGWSVYLEQGDGIVVRYNKFNGPTGGVRVSCTIGNQFTNKNTFIHNNVFVNCSSGVGVAYGNTTPDTRNTKVYNNVFYKCNYHTWVDRSYIDLRNNIHLRDGDSGVAIHNYGSGTWTIMNNCYGDAATAGTPGTGTNPQIGNPSFVNAANRDFHLQSGSICRNTGVLTELLVDTDGTIIPTETNPSIGAFEYVI